jgi:hypothetical protein
VLFSQTVSSLGFGFPLGCPKPSHQVIELGFVAYVQDCLFFAHAGYGIHPVIHDRVVITAFVPRYVYEHLSSSFLTV